MRPIGTSSLPAMQSSGDLTVNQTLEHHYYHRGDVFDYECDQLFRRHWWLVGHSGDFANNGDYWPCGYCAGRCCWCGITTVSCAHFTTCVATAPARWSTASAAIAVISYAVTTAGVTPVPANY